MSIFTAILLGIVHGITEFLPVSGSGHLSVILNIFKLDYVRTEHMLFDAMLHIGTAVSVILVYRKELKAIVQDTMLLMMGREEESDSGRFSPPARTAFFILIATIPLLLVLPFYGKIEELYSNLPFIAFSLIITGAIIYAAGRLDDGRKNEKTSTMLDVFLVGLAQAVAVIPGLSRSAATIATGRTRDFKRDYAIRFSFLLYIPAALGSVIISFINAVKNGVNWSSIPAYIVGMIITAVVGYYAIFIVKKFLKKENFSKLAVYCWAIGFVSLIASLFV